MELFGEFAIAVFAGKAKNTCSTETFYEFLELDPKLAHSDLQSGAKEFAPLDRAKATAGLEAMVYEPA